jgi:FkbM family methyltransferase
MQKLKDFLKKIGIFKYYMYAKKALYLNRKIRKAETINYHNRLNFYKEYISSGDLCFDVGANIGNRTEIFLLLGAKVVAVEPQESCVAILKKKFGTKINLEKTGLGAEKGEMEMFIADESTISTLSAEFIEKTKDNKFKNNSWNSKVIIPITTLDNLVLKYGSPTFCKIDVEGFEPEVLKGLSSPIHKISFEYNVPELSKNVQFCLSHLNSLSKDYIYNYCIGESMKPALANWETYEEFKLTTSGSSFMSSDFGDIYAILK